MLVKVLKIVKTAYILKIFVVKFKKIKTMGGCSNETNYKCMSGTDDPV